MLSLGAMICLVLATIPAVLAGMCSKGWKTAKGPLCTGGGYEECAAHWTAHCWTECYGHAIDLYTMGCHAHCIQRSHQRCSGWCASVGNYADCMKAFQLAAASGNPEAGREQCSKEGSDHYFCGCDRPSRSAKYRGESPWNFTAIMP